MLPSKDTVLAGQVPAMAFSQDGRMSDFYPLGVSA